MVNMEDGVMLGVMAVIAVVAVVIVFGLTQSITVLTSVVNETVTVGSGSVNGTTSQLAHYPLDGTALVLRNSSGSKTLGNPQNYTYATSTGLITWNSSVWGNVSSDSTAFRATYQYQPSGYVTGTNATIVNNYTVLLFLGILVFVGYFVATKFGGLYK